ncbi:MAG: exopolysaccharide biosynthesis polyprenyl glycosylphosphotransferase [Opitutaceae bacterium]|nr:exopolysaccharide biosynthesis polyprenyl glycosylphosphotransferase [Opitutaceae bacterium]
MITTRARGLVNLHAGATTLLVGVFFWVYAEFIMRYVPFVRLSRGVNLIPYFLCVVAGLLLSTRDLAKLSPRFHALRFGDAAALAARQVALMALFTFTMMFATLDRSISRLFLGTFLVWCWIGLTLINARLPRALAQLMFHGGHHLPTLFIGRVASFAKLNDWIANKELLGVQPLGLLSDDPSAADSAAPFVPMLGRVADLPRILQERPVGQVVLLELPATDAEARGVIDICQDHGCRLLIHNNLAERYTHPVVPIIEEGRHFYTLQEEPLEDPLNRLLKRGFDLLIAVPVVLFVLPPLCLCVAVMQRWQAPGPLFHVRPRRGQGGRPFRMLKFRSMHVRPEDPEAESRQARLEDERVFPFGRFMRRRSLDEFPQFLNVLFGEMSVVGPRPYMPLLDEEFRRQIRGYRTRHLVKPGITGLAQSLGFRGEIIETEMLTCRVYWDVYYITHWSVWVDVQITARTLWQLLDPPESAY